MVSKILDAFNLDDELWCARCMAVLGLCAVALGGGLAIGGLETPGFATFVAGFVFVLVGVIMANDVRRKEARKVLFEGRARDTDPLYGCRVCGAPCHTTSAVGIKMIESGFATCAICGGDIGLIDDGTAQRDTVDTPTEPR